MTLAKTQFSGPMRVATGSRWFADRARSAFAGFDISEKLVLNRLFTAN